MEQEKDPQLWKLAEKKAAFRTNLLLYFIMTIFFWTIYYISLRTSTTPPAERDAIPWPVWPMIGWGIAVFLNYRAVYKNTNSMAEKEYEKLKNKQ